MATEKKDTLNSFLDYQNIINNIKGGTTSQFLVKSSDEDHDFSWTTFVASLITDFDEAVTNNEAVSANSDKLTYPTSASDKLATIEENAEVNVVDSVNSKTGIVVLDADDVSDISTTNKFTTQAEINKLGTIEESADVNNISDANATDLTDSGNTALHYHSADRDRTNHTGTQTASTISDFDTEVSNNTSVQANTDAIDAMLGMPTTALVSNVWTIDTDKALYYQTECTTASTDAKTMTISNVHTTADRVAIGIRLVVTTACTITYTNMTFIDGAPTLTAGDVWLIAAETVDNGTSYDALARRIIKA